jgi:hypothetical protein
MKSMFGARLLNCLLNESVKDAPIPLTPTKRALPDITIKIVHMVLSFLSLKDSNIHSPRSPPSRNRHFQKYQSIFPSLLFYARFGMAIFITLCLNIIANTIETIENNTADTNIMLNDAADGKYCAIP